MRWLLFIICLMPHAWAVSADSGQISIRSEYGVKVTLDRLEQVLNEKGMTIIARVDHASAAKKVGKALRPTELMIFGNPKVGTPLMQCGQSIAIDLPQKMLAWEDEQKQVWLTYNDPFYLAKRHGIQGCDEALRKVANALHNIASKVAAH
jgi:uncharacterized protein (DUF302 family)